MGRAAWGNVEFGGRLCGPASASIVKHRPGAVLPAAAVAGLLLIVSSRMASWLRRSVLAGLLLAAYLYAWTPLRTEWTRGTAALLERAAPTTMTVAGRPAAHLVKVRTAEAHVLKYVAPAGVKFLLPGLFLVVAVPGRPRLAAFFGGHLALGALAAGLGAAGLAGLPGGVALSSFVQGYGVDAYSLIVPVLLFVRRRSATSPR
jgi:hypothetical protein